MLMMPNKIYFNLVRKKIHLDAKKIASKGVKHRLFFIKLHFY